MSLIEITEMATAEERANLIAQHIKPDPYRPGAARSVVRGDGAPVWALVSYYMTAGGDVRQVADDYEITPEQVQAVLAFYAEHAEEIDAFLRARMTR